MRLAVTGPPGCGKSTLCIRVAEELKIRGVTVGGFTTAEVRGPGGERTGFELRDLATGRSALLASVEFRARPPTHPVHLGEEGGPLRESRSHDPRGGARSLRLPSQEGARESRSPPPKGEREGWGPSGGPRVGKYRVNIEAARLGAGALRQALGRGDPWLVIDEVAPMELASPDLTTALAEALDSPAHLLASLHLWSSHPLLRRFREACEVHLLDPPNREAVFRRLLDRVIPAGERG